MTLEVIPSVDLRGGRVVRLYQGDFDRETDYGLSPEQQLRAFADAGASRVHVVDLDGAKAGRLEQVELISRLARATAVPLQVGGGVRSTEDIRRLREAGADRVVVGTAALENWSWFEATAHEPAFRGALVLALDARDGVVATRGWTASSQRLAVDVARAVHGWPLAGILYTDVAVDGTLAGPNIERTVALASVTDVPVIASGGVGRLEHIRALVGTPVRGVIVGRAIYEGRVDLSQALTVARGDV